MLDPAPWFPPRAHSIVKMVKNEENSNRVIERERVRLTMQPSDLIDNPLNTPPHSPLTLFTPLDTRNAKNGSQTLKRLREVWMLLLVDMKRWVSMLTRWARKLSIVNGLPPSRNPIWWATLVSRKGGVNEWEILAKSARLDDASNLSRRMEQNFSSNEGGCIWCMGDSTCL